MKKFRNISTIFALLMILTFAISMIVTPQNTNAQSTREIVTWPFVDAIPKIAGVGQPVLINWGLINFLNHVDDGWNVTLQITDPNGKTTNTTAKTWSTGTVGRKMSFMEPGNYTLQTIYDGETYYYVYGGQSLGGYYKPSISEPFTLQILEGYWKVDHPGHTLPEEYWTRPVDSQLREWYTLMGSWLGGSRSGPNGASKYAPYNEGPESAHILWRRPLEDGNGGLAGGETGVIGYQTGDAYEGKFYDAVIVSGVLYYNREFVTSGGSSSPVSSQSLIAIDMHTGKTLWERQYNIGNGRIVRGQTLIFISENNRGAWSYLWIVQGTNMWALDAKNGELRYNMTDVPSGTIYYGPSGEMLVYSVTNTTGTGYRLLQWNSTHVVANSVSGGVSDAWGSQVHTRNANGDIRSFNGTRGYDINVSVSGLTNNPGTIRTVFPGNRLILATNPSETEGFLFTGISLDEENLGYLLFSRQFNAPDYWADFDFSGYSQQGWSTFSEEELVGIFWTNRNRVNYAFSLENGKLLWQTESRYYSDSWGGTGGVIAYGKFYAAAAGGIVYCYDVKTGELLWTYEATDKYNESYHGENWWLTLMFVTDGKIYYGHAIHSPQEPLARGAPFFALDCETGEVVWEITGAFRQTNWGGKAMIGDSIIVTPDTYDEQIYAIGKGPSEMTVAPSNAVTNAGNTVLITGTIMDISPGTQSDDLQMRFSKGVPAVADECMSNWMLYVYKNFARPMDAIGVEVTVFAQQDDKVIDIGTTISDDSGRFSITWTTDEDITGTWDIYAYFSGSASYYGSWAKSEIAILQAPEVIEEKTPPYEWYIVGAAIAIIAVVIVNILVTLRKK